MHEAHEAYGVVRKAQCLLRAPQAERGRPPASRLKAA